MTHRHAHAPAVPDRLLTLDEASAFLGISSRTVSRLIDEGALRPVKVGSQDRFNPYDLLADLGTPRSSGPIESFVAKVWADRQASLPKTTVVPASAGMWDEILGEVHPAAMNEQGLTVHDRSYAAVPPVGAPLVTQLVETVPVDGTIVTEIDFLAAYTRTSRGREGVEPFPSADVELTGDRRDMIPFGLTLPVPDKHLQDDGFVRRWLQWLILRDIAGGLGAEIVAGDGTQFVDTDGATTSRMEGLVAAAADIPDVDATGVAGHTAVSRAASQVQDSGFVYGPLVAVAHPLTLQAIREEENASGSYASRFAPGDPVAAWVPSNALAEGEAYVGDWYEAVALFVNGGGPDAGVALWTDRNPSNREMIAALGEEVVARLFDQHAAFAEQLLVLVRAWAWSWVWVRTPGAMRHVINL